MATSSMRNQSRGSKRTKANYLKTKIIVALCFALVIGGISVYHPRSSNAAAFGYPFCLNSASNDCIQTNGSKEAYISTHSTSRFEVLLDNVSYKKHTVVSFKNASGNCLKGYDVSKVDVAACNTSKGTQQWAIVASFPFRYLNVADAKAGHQNYLVWPQGGSDIWLFVPKHGDWWGWNEP